MRIIDELGARAWLESFPGVDAAALARIEKLIVLLAEENQRQNLVAASSLPDVWRRHVVDSAQLLLHVPRETSGAWMDLGSGAGFPGLVIGVLRPDCDLLLVESRARRIEWLERARLALGLERVRVVGQRLELVETQPVSVISARAFAPLDKLVTLASRFSTSETTWVLPKGRSAQQELEMLRGWQHSFHVEPSLTDDEAGVIVGHLLGKEGRKQ